MAASLSFTLARLHVSSYTQTPQECCLRRHNKIKTAFFCVLSQMQVAQIERKKIPKAVEFYNWQLEELNQEIQSLYPLDYLDLETTKKVNTLSTSKLVEALHLEKPLFADFDQIDTLAGDLEQFYCGSDQKMRMYAKELSLAASNIIDSMECYRLFLKFIIEMPPKFAPHARCFHLPKATDLFFFHGVLSNVTLNCIKQLGEGTYGKVFQVHGFGKDWALKKFKQQQEIADEELMYESLFYIILPPHPNILTMQAITQNGLFFELAQGDLYHRCKDPDYDNARICQDFFQIASALHHIHLQGFNYKDLKPSNILCFPNGRVKLCDLGFLQVAAEDKERTVCPLFAAPEYTLSAESLISSKADVYSFGVCLFQALTRCQYPFLSQLSADPLYLNKVAAFIQSHPVTEELLLSQLDRYTRGILRAKDPHQRLLPLVVACLNFNPELRPSMEDIKQILHEHILHSKTS